MAVSREVLFKIHEHSIRNGYEVGDTTTSTIEAFFTENYDRLFVSFEISWYASSIPLPEGNVMPEGSVSARVRPTTICELARSQPYKSARCSFAHLRERSFRKTEHSLLREQPLLVREQHPTGCAVLWPSEIRNLKSSCSRRTIWGRSRRSRLFDSPRLS